MKFVKTMVKEAIEQNLLRNLILDKKKNYNKFFFLKKNCSQMWILQCLERTFVILGTCKMFLRVNMFGFIWSKKLTRMTCSNSDLFEDSEPTPTTNLKCNHHPKK